jgi:adenylate cyclase
MMAVTSWYRPASFASDTTRLVPTLRRGVTHLLLLAVRLAAATLRLAAPSLLDRLSLIAFDFYRRFEPRRATNSPVAIVDIDNESIAKIGQWP